MLNHPFWSDLNSTRVKTEDGKEKEVRQGHDMRMERTHAMDDRHPTQNVETETRKGEERERRRGHEKRKKKRT